MCAVALGLGVAALGVGVRPAQALASVPVAAGLNLSAPTLRLSTLQR